MKNITIDEIAIQWFELKKPLLATQTYRTYLGFYNNHIYPSLGLRDIKTIHYIDYQKFANSLLSLGRKPKTVKNVVDVLAGIIDFAIKNEWYAGTAHPSMIELPMYDNKFYVTIDVELQKKYLKAIMNFHEPVYKDIFLFLLHGRRLNEVLDLKWEYVDLNVKVLYLLPKYNKSKKHLTFMLTDRLVDALKLHHVEAIERQNTVFPTGHIFLNPMTLKRYFNLTKVWKRLLKRAELPYMKLHAIRHLVGTYLVNELKLPIQEVSIMLGHSSIDITQRYYNPKPSIAKECTESLFDALENNKGEDYVKELDDTLKLGESVKAVALHAKTFQKVTL